MSSRPKSTAESSATPDAMSKKSRSTKKTKVKKLFVLDTNVLMHDPASLFRFEEHDLYLPMGTLEELDSNKKGLSDVARNARQASRFLDEIVSGKAVDLAARSAISPAACRSARARTAPTRPGACSCRPRRSTATCRPPCRPARPTTRSCRWCATCRRRSRSAAWCWCPRTSTCASRRARSASPPRTTTTTRCWRIPTSSTPACASSRRASGTATAATSSPGRRTATATTACAARWCRSCS